jgi:DnaJ-class molecular chaperone
VRDRAPSWKTAGLCGKESNQEHLRCSTLTAGSVLHKDKGKSPKEEEMSEDQEKRQPPAPGDKAQPGAKNVGEDLCPVCGGTGRYKGEECKNCGGSGSVRVPLYTP